MSFTCLDNLYSLFHNVSISLKYERLIIMYLNRIQKKILKKIYKSNFTITYSDLHGYRTFKSDHELHSAVETLKSMGFINYVVLKVKPHELFIKSKNIDEIIQDRFIYVDYLKPSNRLIISDKGIARLQESFDAKCRYWIPIVITIFLNVVSIVLHFI